jgi:transmembrane sensor
MNMDRANREAVDWLLRLESAGASEHQAFAHWLGAAPDNQQAWRRVNSLFAAPLADLAAVEQRSPGQLPLAREALARPLSRRRALGGGLAALLLGAGGASLLQRFTPLESMLADLHTATGELSRNTLADGSRLTLAARSAVDLNFNARQHGITLREGALHLVSSPSAAVLQLSSADGQVFCDGGRFALRRQEGSSLLTVESGRARIVAGSGQVMWAQAGQVVRFGVMGSRLESLSLWSRSDWLDGRVELRNEPLGELIQALRPYHPGWLRISPAAARLPVYGSFVLNDLSRTLQALGETLPLHVQRADRLFTAIDVKNS